MHHTLMRISDRYIGRQVIWSTVFAIVVLSLVLVLGSLSQQIQPLLVEQKIPLSLVARLALDILPSSMMFTIPWGFLSAVLLVFNRLSTEQELTGFHAAGIGLLRLAMPVFILALVMSGVCAWVNVVVTPQARASLDDLIYQEALRNPRALLDPGAVRSRFSNQKVFVEAREPGEDGALLGFHMYQIRKPGDPNGPAPAYIHANRVELKVDQEKQEFRLTLDRAYVESRNDKGEYQPSFSDQTRYWFLSFANSRPKKPRSSGMSTDEIHRFLEENPTLTQKVKVSYRAEIEKRYSYSFACLAFAFVGVPLGLKVRRRDTSTGLFLSMGIGAAYFLSSFVADQLHTDVKTSLAIWLPNVLCALLGIWLFRRARFR